MPGYRLAVDVGGTFTDLLLLNEKSGQLTLAKTPSTPADPSVGVLAGIRKVSGLAGIDPNDISIILHGTTVATNAVLEGKGAKVGLITNRGFEQILHVARGQTPGPLAGWIIMIKPEPMAPLDLTRGISARMNSRGVEQIAPDPAEIERCLRELEAQGIEALTVSLLNAYANSAHEVAVKEIAQRIVPHIPITISTDILPEFREYERTLTTVMNSYLRPKMRVYLDGMRQKLKDSRLTTHMDIVRSDGGVMSIHAAAERPVNTLLSGPSGGAVASAYIAALAGFPDVLSFDMGGTSTDVAISREGKPNLMRETRLGQYPVKVPSVDVHSVGAGGGSIAHVPFTGALRVGPQSAGADPGPACYSRGGTEPTVTDANVVLGYLPPELLGGEMALDTAKASAAVAQAAQALGLELLTAAEGIYDIVNENMFGALRLVSIQRGYDPRQFALLALGGAGPLHANALSKLIGAWPTIIPPTPGVLSALGFLHSDIRSEFSRTFIRTLGKTDRQDVKKTLAALGKQASAWLRSENIESKYHRVHYQVDLRYYRQGYEFSIDVELNEFDKHDAIPKLIKSFKDVHFRNYAFNIEHELEIVNLRAIARGVVPKLELKREKRIATRRTAKASGSTRIYHQGAWVSANIYERAALQPGDTVRGPAIVTQKDSTTLILPQHFGTVDSYLNILIWPVNGTRRTTASHSNGRAGANGANGRPGK